ncbi:MAG TPA: aminopeptidase P N-terminal domain-containing protein [Gemmatimonadaceae bacterium]|nr:aminopeptidase P N-terminal domain-containing protein [Gemmatimonadaceae bacterium]
MHLRLARLFLGAVLVVAAPLANSLDAQVPAQEYAARRAAVLARIDSGVVIAFGEVDPVSDWPTFFQLPHFHYLTGFGEGNAVLLMVKRGGSASTTMFVPHQAEFMARVLGKRTAADALQRSIGIPGRDIAGFRASVDSLVAAGLPVYVVPDVHMADFAEQDSLSRGSRLVAQLRAAHPSLRVTSLDSVVNGMRAKKSAPEIALLQRAVDISGKAHIEAMKAVAPGCGEYEIQSLLEGTFKRLGGDRPAYGSIVGSGPNANILHYMADTRVMRDGELLLIDAATSFDHYAADITRTLPVNGTFTPAQRELYQLVRDAQEAYVRPMKDGVREMESAVAAREVYNKGLLRLGLIESDSATFDAPAGTNCPPTGCPQRALYAWHGYGGHGIGLEVHDPAQYYDGDHVFRAGDVTTVEPGLYVDPSFIASLPDTPKNRVMRAKLAPALAKYSGMGIRIEDDYVVTSSGTEWMSKGTPREITEIEALMKSASPALPGGGTCRPKA